MNSAEHNRLLREGLDLLEQTLSAVGYAHRHLIIHADLKRSNVLGLKHRESRAKVNVLDFGIAQREGKEVSALLREKDVGSCYRRRAAAESDNCSRIREGSNDSGDSAQCK